MSTNIEWTDVTDNIIVVEGGGWWCRMISEGCVNCFAARLNQNDFYGGNHLPYTGDAPKLVLRRDILAGWARQRKAKKHFVASMTDVFGEWVPREWIFEFLDAMSQAPMQTFQVLTKRARRMREMVTEWLAARGRKSVPSHIWIGVSVENQPRANERIPELLKIPATRFLSCEPLISPLDITAFLHFNPRSKVCPECLFATNGEDDLFCPNDGSQLGPDPFVNWVIVGGESGPGARSMHPDWARSLRDQCQAAGVPFFFKQWGEWAPYDRGHIDSKTLAVPGSTDQPFGKFGKKRSGRQLDGREWSEFPKVEVAG